MVRREQDDDEDEGWGPDEDWTDTEDDDDEDSTYPCPYCRAEIHEGAVRCPHCENYISEEDSRGAPKPWWLIAGVTVCLIIVYLRSFGI